MSWDLVFFIQFNQLSSITGYFPHDNFWLRWPLCWRLQWWHQGIIPQVWLITCNIFPLLISLSRPPNTHIYTQNFTVKSCTLFVTLKYFYYVRFLGVLLCSCAQRVLWVHQAELQKCLGCLCMLTNACHVKSWWRKTEEVVFSPAEENNQKSFQSCIICNRRKMRILHVGNLILLI